MIHVTIPAGERRLPFFLALEEWVARHLPADDYFFSWIVSPTVICGRNQDVDKEVNIEYCRQHKIDVVRRRSGGGCVYADRNNIMLSFITPATEVQTTFRELTDRVAGQLRKMGLDAVSGGRNDITIEGRKISGNAFYHLPGRSIVHGTMLFDTDTTHMLNAITPARAKLESKRVQSVESRIITARELMPDCTLDQFHSMLLGGLSDGTYSLSEAEISEVETIEQRYYHPEWLRNAKTSAKADIVATATDYIDGVGNISVSIALDTVGRIQDASLTGDYFALADVDSNIIAHLKGVEAESEAIAQALQNAKPEAISGMTADKLRHLIELAVKNTVEQSSTR